MPRFASRPAPSDAAPLMALLARAEIAGLEAKRQQLMAAIAHVRPRRSTVLEARLKQVAHEILRRQVEIRRSAR